jgi:tRNA-modifying protein YgfZ
MVDHLSATPIERDIVIISGDDAAEYLQTQLTQDVLLLPRGRSRWSFILTPKSEIESLVRVTHTIDGFVFDVATGHGDAVRTRLDGHLFRMDVKFAQHTWPGVAWRGDGAHEVVGDAPVVAPLPWDGVEALDEVGPEVVMPADVEALSPGELDAIRIEQRWPSEAEIEGSTTPAMTGIVENTVNFEKGCYTGQEFVARVHYRDAAPPKRLVQIVFEAGSDVVAGVDITVKDESVGTVTSVAPSVGTGLAYCKRSIAPGTKAFVGDLAAVIR